MKFTTKDIYNAVVIKFKGQLVGGPEAEDFHKVLSDSIAAGKKNVIVDLSDVGFVNSTGIGIVVRGYTTMKEAGGALKLAGVTNKLEGLLSVTKLTSVFELHKDVDEASKSF